MLQGRDNAPNVSCRTIYIGQFASSNHLIMKKCKMVSVFTQPDVNTREVGRTRVKRRKPRREAKWFPAYRVNTDINLKHGNHFTFLL